MRDGKLYECKKKKKKEREKKGSTSARSFHEHIHRTRLACAVQPQPLLQCQHSRVDQSGESYFLLGSAVSQSLALLCWLVVKLGLLQTYLTSPSGTVHTPCAVKATKASFARAISRSPDLQCSTF